MQGTEVGGADPWVASHAADGDGSGKPTAAFRLPIVKTIFVTLSFCAVGEAL